jgi:nitrous oxide reductase
MSRLLLVFTLIAGLSTGSFAQSSPVDKEKFVLLNNGATVGMIIKSALKADKQRLTLTEQQLPKAKEIITNAAVSFNEGVKKLKKAGMSNQKLRALAVVVETDKVRAYKAILTPKQYAVLVANHQKIYPESKV